MDKRHTFEDPKSPNTSSPHSHSANHHSNKTPQTASPDPNNNASAISTQDWLETLARAKEIALSQSTTTNYSSSAFSYSSTGEADALNNISSSGLSDHASTLDAAYGFRSSAGPLDRNTSQDMSLRGEDWSWGERGEESRGNMRATLQKHSPQGHDRGVGLGRSGDGDSIKGSGSGGRSKRFSKRQSKGALAAVF